MSRSNLRILLTIFTVASLSAISISAPTHALAVMQSLDNVTTQDQTFTDDSNVTITPSGSAHVLGWQGYLPISRGGTGVGSFTTGSLLFFNGSTFAQDNSNLFWDDTNNRLGIGTSSPASRLDVNGNTSISGTLNVTGNVTTPNLVPYAGASSDIDLGNHKITLGAWNGTGTIKGVDSPDTVGQTGGNVEIKGGAGNNSYGGGGVSLYGGGGRSPDGWGGDIKLEGGEGGPGGNSTGGSVEFRTGVKYGSGSYGVFKFLNQGQSSTYGILDFSQLTSSNKIFTFPSSTGTFGLLESSQTWTGLNKLEDSNDTTIYVGSSSLSGCIALGDSDGSGVTYITANDGVLTASASKPSICQ